MTPSQCMVAAAVLMGAFLGISAVVSHIRLYWKYLELIGGLTAWQEIFKIKSCHLEDEEKSLYRYEFENNDSINENVRQIIIQKIALYGERGGMQIVKKEDSEQFILCFERKKLEEELTEYLNDAKELIDGYEDLNSFVRDWLKTENDLLDELHKDMLIKYKWISASSNRLITFFSKR